jgi:hypothetical protein
MSEIGIKAKKFFSPFKFDNGLVIFIFWRIFFIEEFKFFCSKIRKITNVMM